MNTSYCIECHKEVAYDVTEKKAVDTVKGIAVEYQEQTAICHDCGNEIWVGFVSDVNLERREQAYRQIADIITVDEIETILKKYNIGKRPLSLLLGFGEITITRYINGSIPSKKNSDKLKEILNSTSAMEQYVKENNNPLLDSACEKIQVALHAINELNTKSRLYKVTQYLLSEKEYATNMVINKLLHFAQTCSILINNSMLFEDESQAWQHGSVYPTVYEAYRQFGHNAISIKRLPKEQIDIPIKDKKLLDDVIEYFGCYEASTLRGMSHTENIWLDARGTTTVTRRSRTITIDSIQTYIEQLKNQKNINTVKEYAEYLRNCDLSHTVALD